MRAYLVDELRESDMQKIRPYLDQRAERSSVEDLYWLHLPDRLLAGVQEAHRDCRPYGAAVEVGDRWVRFELLIRSRSDHRCPCARYADPLQREFVMGFADGMIRDLEIQT